MKNIYSLLLLLFICTAIQAQSLEPTEHKALLTVFVTDFEKVPRAQELVIFESINSGKKVKRLTDEKGSFQILLPEGDSYIVSYKSFLETKEESILEIPDKPGMIHARLTVQMESISKQVYALDLHFYSGEARLQTNAFSHLNELVQQLERKPDIHIEIAGHTDSEGNEEANLQLSKDRAESVKTYLIRKGIDPHRLRTTGYGEIKPIADNYNEAGKAKNRRTEIRIIQSEKVSKL